MPVFIKELVVRARVERNTDKPAPTPPGAGVPAKIDRDAIIQDCVEEVLQVLEKRGER